VSRQKLLFFASWNHEAPPNFHSINGALIKTAIGPRLRTPEAFRKFSRGICGPAYVSIVRFLRGILVRRTIFWFAAFHTAAEMHKYEILW
jgi:hypothetical protein